MLRGQPLLTGLQEAYLDLAFRTLRPLAPGGPGAEGNRVRESLPGRDQAGPGVRDLLRAMMEAALGAAGRGGAVRPGEIRSALGDSLIRELVRAEGRTEAEIVDFISQETPRLVNLSRLGSLMEGLEVGQSMALPLAGAAAGPVERPIIAAEEGPFRELLESLAQVAANPYSILITGPSGTGKELVARRIHELSPFARGPFVALDCAGLPEGLVEAELFGHQKGAFTGAVRARPGKLEQAAGGTLFLDEVAELPVNSQVKLLRFLQERVVERLGGGVPVDLSLKVVAATSRELPKMMEQGLFREDLYYRLATIPVRLPPLRERPMDIPLLIDYYLARAKEETGLARGISQEVRELLGGYGFPGNVRELINMVNQMVALSRKHIIGLEDLPRSVRESLGGGDQGREDRLAQLDQAGVRPQDRPTLAGLLARSRGELISNADLRKALGCSDTTAKKILNRLAQAGLVRAQGHRGGRRYLVGTELEEKEK